VYGTGNDNLMGFIVFIALLPLLYVFWNGAKSFLYIPTRLEDWIERNGFILRILEWSEIVILVIAAFLLSTYLEQFLPSLSLR